MSELANAEASEGQEVQQTSAEQSAPELNIERSPVVDLSPTVKTARDDNSAISSTIASDVTSNWFYADGIGGAGEKPSWFNEKTFSTVEEQAKAQNEARKKLGAFVGAPEDGYQLSFSEEHKDFQLDDRDPFLNKFADLATSLNMSQDGFSQILNMYADEVRQISSDEHEDEQTYWQNEMDKLGPNGAEELKVLKQWSRNALPEELHGKFDDLITSADSVKIFQSLIDKTVPTQLTHVAPGTGLNRNQLRDLMSNPLYGRDKDFTTHVDAEAEALYGRTKIYD